MDRVAGSYTRSHLLQTFLRVVAFGLWLMVVTPRESTSAWITYQYSAFQIALIAQGHSPPHIWTPGMSHLKRHPQAEVSVLSPCSTVSSALGLPAKQIREENGSSLKLSCKFPQAEGLKETGPGQNDLRQLPRERTLLLRMFCSLPRLLP